MDKGHKRASCGPGVRANEERTLSSKSVLHLVILTAHAELVLFPCLAGDWSVRKAGERHFSGYHERQVFPFASILDSTATLSQL